MKFTMNDPALKHRRRELRKNQTEAEKAIWARIRKGQFYGIRFYRQYSVGPYILDFYCPKLKLAIELDGGQHLQDDNREYDAGRSVYLKSQGIDVMRFWNHEALSDTEAVLTQIAEKIHNHTIPPLNIRGG
jgi:very-short-patch-repair endonuclease